MPASDILSPSDVDEFRALVVDLSMPDRFELIRAKPGSDWNADIAATSTVIASGPCFLDAQYSLRKADLQQVNEITNEVVPWLINVPYGTAAKPEDFMNVNGVPYQVLAIVEGGNWTMNTTLVAKRIG